MITWPFSVFFRVFTESQSICAPRCVDGDGSCSVYNWYYMNCIFKMICLESLTLIVRWSRIQWVEVFVNLRRLLRVLLAQHYQHLVSLEHVNIPLQMDIVKRISCLQIRSQDGNASGKLSR